MRRDLAQAIGLIRYAFLMQSPLTCFTFSIWESEKAIMEFSNVQSHIKALRGARQHCREIWSAYWYVDGVARFAHEWPGSVAWPEMGPHAWHLNRVVPTDKEKAAVR